MEKVLKVFTYINSELKPFPNEKEQIEISAFVYSTKRMGAAPSISATIKHAQCLDELWTGAECVEFRGEKYFLRSTPTSSYDNTDVRYKHECYFQSERILLENVYYYDVVSNNGDDKPASNNTNFSFFGTIFEFVQRINSSLNYSGITGYNIVVDEDVEEDEKNLIPKSVSFQNQFIGNVIQEIYNTYKIPYYFVGKTIHVGFHEKIVPTKLKYGINDSLLSITKTNANNKVVNRITATGSTENIPYYYPNESSKGELGVVVEKGNIAAQIVNPEIFAQTVSTIEKLVYSKNDGLLETALDSLFVTKRNKNNSESEKVVFSSDPSKIEYSGVSVQDGTYVNIMASARFGAWSDGNYTFEIKKGKADSENNVAKIYRIEISTIYDDSSLNSVVESVDYGDEIADQDVSVDFDFKHLPIGTIRFFKVTVYMNQYPNEGVKELSYSNTLSFVGKDTSLVWKNDSRGTKKKDISEFGLSIDGTPSIGDTIGQKIIGYITPQPTLMPPKYRDTDGRERFYNAANGTYEGFHFDNPFIEGRPSEYIVNLDHIKPSIEGTEVDGLRIDMFSEFAYNEGDSDEFISDGTESEKLLHPYFFGKLRKMDFNLFDHAIESGEMTVAMTSGSCASCNFVIQVDSPETQRNSVQVNQDGTLKKDDNGHVVFGTPQENQNDTSKYEVWVALKKEQSTFGIVMPNAFANYKPKAASPNNNDGDTFVFLNINLPQEYIYSAERKLEHEMLTYMSQNNSEKFNFSIKFSRIFLEENQGVFENLTENSIVSVEYNGNVYDLYVSSYTYRMSNGDILPEITVELFDTLAITQNVIQKAVGEVKSDLLSVSTVVDAYKSSMSKSIRKDKSDSTPFRLTAGDMLVKKRMPTGFSEESGGNLDVEGKANIGGDTNVQGGITIQNNANVKNSISVEKNATIKENAAIGGEFEVAKNAEIKQKATIGDNATLKGGSNKIFGDVTFGKEGTDTEYTEGVKGCKIYFNGSGWAIDTDYLSVNKRMYAKSIQVDEVDHVGGQIILTDASCVADKVEEKEDYYRVHFRAKDGEGRKVYNQWRVGDQAYCQIFNIDKGVTEDFSNRYYWRLVVGVGSDDEFHYIDLSKSVCDISGDLKMDNDAYTTPMPDDPIVQLGYRRQSGDDDEFVKQRQGATMISGGGRQGRSIRMWEKIDSFILPEPRVLISPSNVEMTLNKLHIKTTGDDEEVKDVIDYVQEFQEQFHIFELDTNEMPTLENEPYITWTEEEKVRYSTSPNNAVVINADGRTWRFIVTDGVYSFEEFTDPWLLAQHKDLQTILDDNVIAADEKLTFIEMGTRIAQESVQERNKYQAVTSPSTALTTAYTNYTSAMTTLMTVLANIKSLTPPIRLKTDTESGDIAYTRNGLQSLVVTYDVRLAAWRDAYEDFKRDKSSIDTLQDAKDYTNGEIDKILETTSKEYIDGLIKDFTEGKFVSNSDFIATKERLTAVYNWAGEDKNSFSSSGLQATLDEMYVGTSTVKLDAEGNVENISKSGLVTTTNFASVFAEETGKDGKTVSAIISAFVDEGVSNITLTADKIFIESGSPAFSNYFKLENGNVTMQDLYCHDITVEGVINNLITEIKTDNRTNYGYFDSNNHSLFLNPLKCGANVSIERGAFNTLILPVALWDGPGTSIQWIKGYEGGNPVSGTLSELRQCVGKRFWILDSGNNSLNFQSGDEGDRLLMWKSISFDGSATMDFQGIEDEQEITERMQLLHSTAFNGDYRTFIIECKMGMYDDHECIYWELISTGAKLT